jgi:Tol biopolymer transport system component
LCLSSDGRHVVYDVADPRTGNVDIWSLDLTNAATTNRLTFHSASDFYVACAPASDDVIFTSPRKGTPNLYRLKLSSPGGETSLGESTQPMLPTQWTRDGRTLLFATFSPKTDFDIWMVPVTGGTATAVVATEAADKGGQLSWDGKWIAYASGQAGNYEVFVQAFPPAGARWQISKNGGRQPQWAPDGKQLFYISPEKKLIAVDVDGSTPRFVVKSSRVLVDTRVGGWERTHLGNPYAISADGTRLLVANASDESLPVTVMLNWLSQMR